MIYTFLEEFPIVTYRTLGNGIPCVYVFKEEIRIFVIGDEIGSYLKNTDLLGMLYPRAPEILEEVEKLFRINSSLGRHDYYCVVYESGMCKWS